MIEIADVTLAEGLDELGAHLTAEDRIVLAARLAEIGIRRIELRRAGLSERGAMQVANPADRSVRSCAVWDEGEVRGAPALDIDAVRIRVPASDGFARRVMQTDQANALRRARDLMRVAEGLGLRSTAVVSVAFGCPFDGPVDPETVREAAHELREAGAAEVVLVDSIGVATPTSTKRLVAGLAAGGRVGVHLHDTRHAGYVCAWAAVEAGAASLEGALGGVGLTAFAPESPGNLATEDIVALLDAQGVESGVDADAAVALARWLEARVRRQLRGAVARIGGFISRQDAAGVTTARSPQAAARPTP